MTDNRRGPQQLTPIQIAGTKIYASLRALSERGLTMFGAPPRNAQEWTDADWLAWVDQVDGKLKTWAANSLLDVELSEMHSAGSREKHYVATPVESTNGVVKA